jgi:hypothetical protein
MIEFDTAGPPAPRGLTPQAAPRQATQSWLREWEQARWQEQPRYETLRQQDGQAASTPETAAMFAATTLSDALPVGGPQTAPFVHDGGGHAVEPPLGVADARFPPHAYRPNVAAAIVPHAPSLLAGAKAMRAVLPVAATSAFDPSARSEWAAHSVHVHVGEQATSVWIRDAKMTAQQALGLLERLRPSLSMAGGAAVPLQLTLNGQAVEHTPPTSIEGEPPWQLNRLD